MTAPGPAPASKKPPIAVLTEQVEALAGREVTYRKATVVGTIPSLRIISVDIENAGELEGIPIQEGSFFPKIGDVGEVRLQGSRVTWVVNRIAPDAVGLDELAPVVTDEIAASKARSETAIGQAEAANAAASQAATAALAADSAALDSAAQASLAAQRAEAARVAAEEAEASSGAATGSVLEAQNAADAANEAAQAALGQATAAGTSVTAAQQAAAVAQQQATEAQEQATLAGTEAAAADAKAAQAAADAAKAAADALLAKQQADAARAAADAAAASAGQAQQIAQTAANGKNTITYSLSTSPTTGNEGRVAGDTWFRRDANGTIIEHWEWVVPTSGTASWVQRTIASQVIANLDVGKLTTGSIAAGQKISAGPLAGTHAEMAFDGFRVFVEDTTDNIPNEVVRMGTATNDFIAVVGADGNIKGSFDDTGRVSASEVSTDSLVVAGKSVTKMISDGPRGLVGRYSAIANPLQFWDRIGIAEVGMVLEAGRAYKVSFKSTFRVTTNGDEVRFKLHWSEGPANDTLTSAPAPTINSPVMNTWFVTGHIAGRNYMGEGETTFYPTITRRYRLLLSVERGVPDTLDNANIIQDAVEISVIDEGVAPSMTGGLTTAGGTNRGGTGTAPPPPTVAQSYYVDLAPDGRRSYTGSGQLMTWVGNDVYQGYQSANGDTSGQFYFNLPSITGTVTGVVVWAYFRHWHYNSGGTVRMGLTDQRGYFTRHSFKPIYETGGWPKPGAREIFLPSDWWPLFRGTDNLDKNGRATVITLGPGGGTNPLFYGVCTDMRLRIAYDQ